MFLERTRDINSLRRSTESLSIRDVRNVQRAGVNAVVAPTAQHDQVDFRVRPGVLVVLQVVQSENAGIGLHVHRNDPAARATLVLVTQVNGPLNLDRNPSVMRNRDAIAVLSPGGYYSLDEPSSIFMASARASALRRTNLP